MELSVVIINWNAAEDTIRCVQHVTSWQTVRPQLWVVDNASLDDSVTRIAHACPHVHLIRSQQNLGFAGGANLGVQAALAISDAPILLLNNDAEMGEVDAAFLVKTLSENQQIGLVTPVLYDEAGELISAGGKNPVKHMQTRVQELPEGDPVGIVDVVSGTAVLIHSTIFAQIGLLDERFFFSTEVADLCLRAAKAGYLCAVDSRARASHAIGRSSRLRDTLYVYYIVRNRFLILRNHYRRNVWLFAFWILYSLALTVKLAAGKKQPSARAVWLALWDGVRGRFGGQNEQVLDFCGLHQTRSDSPQGR
jgi:GT2 family glycosyltransferase